MSQGQGTAVGSRDWQRVSHALLKPFSGSPQQNPSATLFSVLVVSSFPGDIWQRLEMFGVVKTEEVYYWHLAGRGRGCWCARCNKRTAVLTTHPVAQCQRCSGWDTWRHLPTTHPPTTAGQERAASPFSSQWTLPTFVHTVLLPVEIPLHSKTEAKHRWAFSALACSVLQKHRDCSEGSVNSLL